MTKTKPFLFCCSLFLSSGCATVIDGTKQSISVNSNVSGAEVLFNGQSIGVTPLTVQVPKKKDSQLMVKKAGHTAVTLTMSTSTVSSFIWGDVILGGIVLGVLPGLISTTVDASNSSMYEYSPNNFFASLEPQTASIDERNHHQSQDEVIRFCLKSYDHITREVANGKGEYTGALCQLLGYGAGCWTKPDAIKEVWRANPGAAPFALASAKLRADHT